MTKQNDDDDDDDDGDDDDDEDHDTMITSAQATFTDLFGNALNRMIVYKTFI